MTTNNNNDNRILLTNEGVALLKEEYELLTKVQRPQILKDLETARSLGDLSENGMFSVSKEKQAFLEGRINEIENILKNAEVVKPLTGKREMAEIGTTVLLESQKQKVEYSIVGAEEVDIANKKISHESPLGKALIGKKVGDTIEVDAPIGVVKYVVVNIS